MPDRLLELTIGESGSGAGAVFTLHVRLDGLVMASNQDLTADQSRMVRDLSRQYGQLFEQRRMPQLARETLAGIGTELFRLWLGPHWEKLSQTLKPGEPRTLVIASGLSSVLNLPWELLRPADGEAIGTNGNWGLRRLPWFDRTLEAGNGELPAGPLRVLYMVSAPRDQAELDFEREEELLVRTFGKAGRNVVFDSGDLGSFEELRERINDFHPHVVHLTGHGVARAEAAYFAFEDDRGESDERAASELGQLFAGSGVQCAFVSACQAGRAPERAALGGLAQGLLAEGVPLVIGWTASILDDVATQVAGAFYDAVSSGRTAVDRALMTARQVVRKACEERGDPSWSLPVLYAGTRQALLFDARRIEPSERPSLVLRPLPGMVSGYAEHFIGRRRELQRLLPGLRAGELQTVVLTGLGGAGKSTLASRLARKLEVEGWTLLALSSSAQTPLSAAQLLQACGDAFLAAGQRDAFAMLRDATLSVEDRLHALVTGLNRGRFVLVLDNFESNLDRDSRRILDAELARFYAHLLDHLVGGSRVIITSRYLPADVSPLPATVREEQVGEFGEAAFLKFLLRDAVVERRYQAAVSPDHLPHELLARLHRLLGATPRFLGQIREVLASMPAAELKAELDRVALPSEAQEQAEPGRLQAARDAYCEAIFTGLLYGRLPPEGQSMLSRAAVYGLPVTLEGLAAVAGAPEAVVRQAADQWRAAALVHVDRSGGRDLWLVYGMLRGWLLAPERIGQAALQAAQVAAGDFLTELNRQDREGELGVNWVTCLLEARAQYLAVGALDKAREVTGRISGFYVRQGLYAELEALHAELLARQEHAETLSWLGRAHSDRGQYGTARRHYERALQLAGEGDLAQMAKALYSLATIDLNEGAYGPAREKSERALAIMQQTGDRAGEASTWHQLATIDLEEGAYGPAREKFERSLAIKQQIGDRAREATSWHQLATIDLEEGAYGPAREKFERALNINQQIGDRAGEAASFYQLGILAITQGNSAGGLRLIMVCHLIDRAIGHGDSESDLRAVAQVAGQLDLTAQQTAALMQQVNDVYQRDRGAEMLKQAFAA
jgi:tetratricopeptide (TPR) repeat protein